MRFYLISDNVDTQVGMRLAGIEGVVVHEAEEVRRELTKAMDMEDVVNSIRRSTTMRRNNAKRLKKKLQNLKKKN